MMRWVYPGNVVEVCAWDVNFEFLFTDAKE
jgi:hypothetical protein